MYYTKSLYPEKTLLNIYDVSSEARIAFYLSISFVIPTVQIIKVYEFNKQFQHKYSEYNSGIIIVVIY